MIPTRFDPMKRKIEFELNLLKNMADSTPTKPTYFVSKKKLINANFRL